LLEKKEEWVQLFRAELPIGGHHTKNYSEASVRVLKDVVLERTKAFNSVSLADYIATGWETYLQTRLARFAYRKNNQGSLMYNDLLKRMPVELAEKILVIDEDTYHVPSSKDGEPTYEVTVSVGACTCRAGAAGAFCKHQALVHNKFGRLFPNQPLMSSPDFYLIGKLAFGSECPPKTFFLDKKETLEQFEKCLQDMEFAHSSFSMALNESSQSPPETSDVQFEERAVSPDPPATEDVGDSDEVCHKFFENWKRICTLGSVGSKAAFFKQMKKATKAMENCNNPNLAFDAMMRTVAVFSGQRPRSGVQIKVNSAAIQRRRKGVTRGS